MNLNQIQNKLDNILPVYNELRLHAQTLGKKNKSRKLINKALTELPLETLVLQEYPKEEKLPPIPEFWEFNLPDGSIRTVMKREFKG